LQKERLRRADQACQPASGSGEDRDFNTGRQPIIHKQTIGVRKQLAAIAGLKRFPFPFPVLDTGILNGERELETGNPKAAATADSRC